MCFEYVDDYVEENKIECRMAWKVFSLQPSSQELQSAFDLDITDCGGLFYKKNIPIEYHRRITHAIHGIYS